MTYRRSAGGIVVGPQGKVIVVSQNRDSWSIPKGGIEDGEDDVTAAKREIYEETGVTELELVKELGTYRRHRIAKGGIGEDTDILMEIKLFLFSTKETELRAVDPTNSAKWVAPAEALSILTHEKDIDFYNRHLSDIEALAAEVA